MNGRAWSGLRAPESTTAGGSKMALEDLMASLGPAYVFVSHVVLSSAAIFLFQEEMGISCELLESDFLKCSVGFPFMRSKSKVRPWQRWVLPRPLSPALPISPLLLCTHAHPAPVVAGWLLGPGVCLSLVLCSRWSVVTSPVSLSHILPNQGWHLCALLMVNVFVIFSFYGIFCMILSLQ